MILTHGKQQWVDHQLLPASPTKFSTTKNGDSIEPHNYSIFKALMYERNYPMPPVSQLSA